MSNAKLIALIQEVSKLALRRYPDLPASMHIEKYDSETLARVVGFVLPNPLVTLYCTALLVTEPWQKIMLYPPSGVTFHCDVYNDQARDHSPPMKVEAGINVPVKFGRNLIVFGYYDDSVYCIDSNPNVATGGVMHQVVNVSLRKGLARVAFPSLEAFLENGIKSMKREIKRDLAEEKKRAAENEMTPERLAEAEAMLRDPMAYWQKTMDTLRAAVNLASVQTVAQPLTDAERRELAVKLVTSNPQTTPLQRACAELVECYVRSSDCDGALEDTLPPMPLARRSKIEKALSIKLPPDLHELLDAHQRIGIPWDNAVSLGIEDDIVARCKDLKSIKMPSDGWGLWPGTAVPVFGRGLLPLGGDGDPVICYDLAPGDGGVVGQLVEVSFEECTCKVIAKSLLEFLSQGLEVIKRNFVFCPRPSSTQGAPPYP